VAETYGTCVTYYPPTTGHPYLVVTFLADRSLQTTPFDSEEAAEAFMSGTPRGYPAEAPAARDPKPLNDRFGK
jgi:hypothetical protein